MPPGRTRCRPGGDHLLANAGEEAVPAPPRRYRHDLIGLKVENNDSVLKIEVKTAR
jgi:hypothetical protein